MTGSGPGSQRPFEPPEPSGFLRGIAIVVFVVVIAALLLPSATRAPLAVVASRSSTTSATTTPTTAASGHSGRTTTSVATHSGTSTAPPPAPSTVHVLVANATSVNGVAGSVTSFLGGKGFATLTATNSLVKLTATQLYPLSAGDVAAASEVASVLGLAQAVVQPAGGKPPVSSVGNASVVVIAGSDLASRFAASTTTTAARG